MVEVTLAYTRSHDVAIVYYQSAMYEVPYNALHRAGGSNRYKINATYLTARNLYAQL